LLWTPLHLCAIVASNLPDLDMVYAGVTGGKLGYLLHHRGHTHTFVVAVLLALLLSAGCYTWFRRRQTPPRRALGLLAFSTLGGVGLHIGMDYGNSYGVHPWWPFDNHWYYGDSVFIIEPWLFAALAVPALFSVRTRVMRGILLLLLTVV